MRLKNVLFTTISGGCTSQIQTLDVCINRPFKARMEDLFDDFMGDHSKHSFTKGGNLKSASMTQICDMVMEAWNDITPDIILKSFKVCGQAPDTEVSDILAFKEGKTCALGRETLENLWSVDIDTVDLDLLTLKKVENTLNVDVSNINSGMNDFNDSDDDNYNNDPLM